MKVKVVLMEIINKEQDSVEERFSQVSDFTISDNGYGIKENYCDFMIPIENSEISVELGADEAFESVNFRVLINDESYHFGMIATCGRTAYFQLRCLEKFVLELNIFS